MAFCRGLTGRASLTVHASPRTIAKQHEICALHEIPAHIATRNNENMSSRSHRVSSGIDSLVRRLLVEIPGEDPASAEEREQNAVDFVREFLGK